MRNSINKFRKKKTLRFKITYPQFLRVVLSSFLLKIYLDDDDSDENEEEELPKPTLAPKQQEIKSTPTQPSKPDNQESEEEDDEDDDEEEQLVLPKQLRSPRKTPSGISWHKSIQAQHMAEDQHSPRMSLLKGKNVSFFEFA